MWKKLLATSLVAAGSLALAGCATHRDADPMDRPAPTGVRDPVMHERPAGAAEGPLDRPVRPDAPAPPTDPHLPDMPRDSDLEPDPAAPPPDPAIERQPRPETLPPSPRPEEPIEPAPGVPIEEDDAQMQQQTAPAPGGGTSGGATGAP